MQEIYLDNHATTRVDSRVIEAMIPWMNDEFANAGSHTHGSGRRAAAMVEQCTEQILGLLGAPNHELVFTSGATESINLAIFGTFSHPKQPRRSLLVGLADHRAVLDCAKRLKTLEFGDQKLGNQSFSVGYLKVEDATSQQAGAIDLEALQEALNENVAMVSVILGNNEIGTLQNIEPLAKACHNVGALLHIDATQAIGKIDFRVEETQADFVSFSAHKFYGPKGIGGLLVPKERLRLRPQIIGGGQSAIRDVKYPWNCGDVPSFGDCRRGAAIRSSAIANVAKAALGSILRVDRGTRAKRAPDRGWLAPDRTIAR